MKKSLAVLAVLVLVAGLSTSAFAERWGKPGANLEKGQWSLGLEYNYVETEIDLRVPQGVVPQLGEEQAVLNQILVRVGYGLTDKVEAFIKMGGTSTDVSDAFLDPAFNFNQDLEGNLEFTIAGGLKATLYEKDNLRVGAQGQFVYFETDDTADGPGFMQAIDADIWEFEGALLVSYDLGKVTPYLGICMVIGDADVRYRAFTAAGGPVMLYDVDVEQEDWFGMVAGVNCEVMDNVRVGIELTHVSEGVGLSVGVNCAL